jgi:signal transduction histidine kinase
MVSVRPGRPTAVDTALAVFFAVVVVVEAYTEPIVRNPAWHAAVAGPAMLVMAWRRVHPLPVAVAVAVAVVLLAANGGGLSVALALLIVSFTLGSEAERRASRLGLVLLLVLTSVGVLIEANEAVAGDAAAVVTLVVVPWLAGRALRQRADNVAEAIAQAERRELSHERELERAAAQERIRLARELHDVVSHSISVIAIQVQAVRRRLGSEQSREIADLTNVETAAREAMAELRRLFGVLRVEGETAALSPQPGLGELDRLLGQLRGSGVEVELVTEGEPQELPAGLDLAAYRIVQEAVTNALRHSGGRHVAVHLDYRPAELEVSVEDDGHGIDGGGNGTVGGGHGLRGIRERAEMYGGTLDVGGGPAGGTRVTARLPTGAER